MSESKVAAETLAMAVWRVREMADSCGFVELWEIVRSTLTVSVAGGFSNFLKVSVFTTTLFVVSVFACEVEVARQFCLCAGSNVGLPCIR